MLIVKLDLQSAGSSPNLSYTKSSARDAIRIRGQKKPSGGWEYLINPPLPNSDQHSGDKIPCPHVFVKLRSRSRSGEGQVRVRRVTTQMTKVR